MADPDLQKREGSGHPDPEIDGGGGAVLKKIFRLLGPTQEKILSFQNGLLLETIQNKLSNIGITLEYIIIS